MKKTLRAIAAISLLGLVALTAPAPHAAAGSTFTITVQKVIVGTPPAGAQFAVQIDCGTGFVTDLTFAANDLGPKTTTVAPGNCTVTETDQSGASQVGYTCVITGPGIGSCTPSTSGVSVLNIGSGNSSDALITVTNTYVATTTTTTPATASPVVATPAFTG